MERIKQAIEKARLQQGQVDAEASIATPSYTAASRNQGQVDVGAIRYATTKTVDLLPSHMEKHRIVAFNKNDPTSIAFDMLRTQVLQKMEQHGWRTLAITSPTPGAGKTVVAINLAISIAHQPEKSAMLVDFDLRKPSVAQYLGLNISKSLNDVILGDEKLSDVMINPGVPRFVVLPTMKPVPKSAEILSSKKVRLLVQELRERYDSRIVLFDLPPLLHTDDAIALVRQVDCVLMVIGNGMSTKTEIEHSLRHLPSANVLGVVLNMAESEQKKYYR